MIGVLAAAALVAVSGRAGDLDIDLDVRLSLMGELTDQRDDLSWQTRLFYEDYEVLDLSGVNSVAFAALSVGTVAGAWQVEAAWSRSLLVATSELKWPDTGTYVRLARPLGATRLAVVVFPWADRSGHVGFRRMASFPGPLAKLGRGARLDLEGEAFWATLGVSRIDGRPKYPDQMPNGSLALADTSSSLARAGAGLRLEHLGVDAEVGYQHGFSDYTTAVGALLMSYDSLGPPRRPTELGSFTPAAFLGDSLVHDPRPAAAYLKASGQLTMVRQNLHIETITGAFEGATRQNGYAADVMLEVGAPSWAFRLLAYCQTLGYVLRDRPRAVGFAYLDSSYQKRPVVGGMLSAEYLGLVEYFDLGASAGVERPGDREFGGRIDSVFLHDGTVEIPEWPVTEPSTMLAARVWLHVHLGEVFALALELAALRDRNRTSGILEPASDYYDLEPGTEILSGTFVLRVRL